MILKWLSEHYIELFGAISGIVYVFLEIKQIVWLWPLGIATSALYIVVFFTTRFYADMSLQVYYLAISIIGWYWWIKGTGHRAQGERRKAQGTELRAQGDEQGTHNTELGVQVTEEKTMENGSDLSDGREKVAEELKNDGGLFVTRLKFKTGLVLGVVFIVLYCLMRYILSNYTDSPVPEWDSFLTSLSIIATWMLARKIFEHWYLWLIVDSVSTVVFCIKGLYPTVALYAVYTVMSFAGLREWRKSIISIT